MFYTYIWRDAVGTPFYVGKGKGKRANETGAGKRSVDFFAIYDKGDCTVEIADEFMLESQAHAHEIELIERYGRREFGGTLVNKTDGGDGVSGYAPSEETRARLRAAGIGKKHTQETRSKMGAAHLGKKHTPEARAKMSAALSGRLCTPETRERLAAAGLGKKHSPETRDKLGAAQRSRGPLIGAYKGVSFHKASKKWQASINSPLQINLGLFTTPEEAARAYDAAARSAWGEGCYLNFREAA